MTTNVKMILDEVNARIKLAEAKTAEDPSNFDSFPGAENDKKVPSGTKKPDPEVKEEGPASRTEVDGAEPGSDVKNQQDHLYEADEPVLTPEKKPAETDDANAKEASANPEVTKTAAEILGIIRQGLTNTAKKPEKRAENNMINLGSSIMDKIASVRMAKQAGANGAMQLIKAAQDYNQGAADARAMIQKVAQAMAEQEAAAAQDAQDAGAADAAEAAGAADADAAIADAAAQDAAASDTGAEDPVTPEEVAQAVGELVQEGQISQEDAAQLISQMEGGEAAGDEGDDIDEDQLAEGIAQAIESGEITEDEAQQLVQELVGAGADDSLQEQVADAGSAEATPDDAAAAEAAGAADAEAAVADAQKTAEALQKQAEEDQVARYQRGFIQKCAEYGVDPSRLAQYIQARTSGQL